MMRAVGWRWLALVGLCACRHNYWAAQGDTEFEAGRILEAIANYQNALRDLDPGADPGPLEARLAELQQIAWDTHLTQSRSLQHQPTYLAAYYGGLAQASWMPQTQRPALEKEVLLFWKQQEPIVSQLLSDNRVEDALNLILATRVQGLEALDYRMRWMGVARAQHEFLAAQNKGLVAAVHATLAQQMGGAGPAPPIAPPRDGWVVQVEGENCSWLNGVQVAPNGAGVIQVLRLRLERCQVTQEETSSQIQLPYPAVVEDAQGQSLVVQQNKLVRQQIRKISGQVQGALIGPRDSFSRPLNLGISRVDTSYWSPGSSKIFSYGIDSLHQELRQQLTTELWSLVQVLDASRRQGDLARLADPNLPDSESEAIRLEAAMYGQTFLLEPMAVKYGISSARILYILRGQNALPAPMVQRIEPTAVGLNDAFRGRLWLDRVQSGEEDREVPRVLEPGLDFGFRIEQAPIGPQKRAHAGWIRARFPDHVTAELGLGTPSLGGEADLFHLGLYGHSVVEELGFFFSLGLEYQRVQAGAGRERQVFFGLPVRLGWAPTDGLLLEFALRPNFLSLGYLGDVPDHIRLYAPVSVATSVDMGSRFYWRGALVHYLGTGGEQPLLGSLELGVRL